MAGRTRLSRCPVCHSSGYVDWGIGPVEVPAFCNVLADSEEKARRQPRGQVELAQCNSCSHVWNRRFEPSISVYQDGGYENSLHFSPTFDNYAKRLAESLVRDFAVGQTVVDIGCGAGDFLRMLRRAGAARALGFDPSLPFQGVRADDEVELAARTAIAADVEGAALVVSRHVLEHLVDPGEVVAAARGGHGRRPAIYFEVPSGEYLLRNNAVWDVIHEHPQHFTRGSLLELLAEYDLQADRIEETFADQFLSVWLSRANPQVPSHAGSDPNECLPGLAEFGSQFTKTVSYWSSRLQNLKGLVALWGAGSKGVTFLNLVAGTLDLTVVDSNPRKQGRFVAGTGHRILPPEALQWQAPKSVLVMNPEYVREIETELESMGVAATVISVADAARSCG